MWFKNNRTQRVVINGCHSSWAVVKSGVPQGSLLGPLLFLVYVNALALIPKLTQAENWDVWSVRWTLVSLLLAISLGTFTLILLPLKPARCLDSLKETAPRTCLSNYTALVRSHLGYCSQVWAPQSVIRDLSAIEKVQRRATKFLYNYSNALSYRDRLLGLQLLPINYWLEYLDFVFFFKCKTNVYTFDLRNYMYQPRCSTRSSSSGNNFR